MAGLAVYRDLLANRPLTKLLVGQFISRIRDWLYIVAIFVVIYRETGDAALVGLFGAVRVIPWPVRRRRLGRGQLTPDDPASRPG